tara:strand:- start:125 stop:1339 length:1215 start_codon:yes stop_codon:yes gene_type:complete
MGQTKSYTALETFQNDCVSIYRRAASTSLNYHTRIRVPGVAGYIIKSCRTPDRDFAYRFAMDLYESLRLKVMAGEAINAPSVDKVIEEFLTTQQAKSANRYRDINNIIGKHFRSYTEGQKVDWLDSASITGYFDWRRQQSRWGRNTSENTINSEAGEVLRFLRWCKDRKYLREVPSFEKPSRKDVRRPAFNRDDWNKVIRQSSSWINEHSHPSIKRDRALCWNYALILINTGIRVGEARTLRWRDIRLEPQAPNKDVNVIFRVDGKTGEREVVARNYKNGVVEYLQRIKALYDDPKPDDFLFAHPDGKPIKSFKRAFSSLIKFADVEFDGAGNRHTIYSCRHTYCVMRLTEGTGVYILARNMGTSVAMIERYYGQTRTPDQAADLNKMRTNARTAGSILADLDV